MKRHSAEEAAVAAGSLVGSASLAMSRELLSEYGEAWNSHDPDLLMGYMAAECTYYASFGPELEGRAYVGREAVREGFARFFELYPDGRFVDSEVWVLDRERGAACWTFVAGRPDGSELRVRGCDLFEFEGEKVKSKNAFRKQDESP
jgi:ketosteroid isomerase-like protein